MIAAPIGGGLLVEVALGGRVAGINVAEIALGIERRQIAELDDLAPLLAHRRLAAADALDEIRAAKLLGSTRM